MSKISAEFMLTNSYDTAVPVKGSLLASAIDHNEREYIFYKSTSNHLCYIMSKSDGGDGVGYTAHDTGLHSTDFDVTVFLNQFHRVVAFVEYWPSTKLSGSKTATLLFDEYGNLKVTRDFTVPEDNFFDFRNGFKGIRQSGTFSFKRSSKHFDGYYIHAYRLNAEHYKHQSIHSYYRTSVQSNFRQR